MLTDYFIALSVFFAAWISIISRIYSVLFVKDEKIGAISRTSAEKAKAEELKKEQKGLGTLFKSKAFMINLVITLALTLIFIWLAVSVSTDGEVNSFDPFSILEIDSGSDAKAIKKAFR